MIDRKTISVVDDKLASSPKVYLGYSGEIDLVIMYVNGRIIAEIIN